VKKPSLVIVMSRVKNKLIAQLVKDNFVSLNTSWADFLFHVVQNWSEKLSSSRFIHLWGVNVDQQLNLGSSNVLHFFLG